MLPSPLGSSARNRGEAGVSHLLHTRRPSHLRAFLDKHGNVEGEVLDRLIDLNVVLPGGGVAPQLTVVTSTSARSGVAVPVKDAHAASVVTSEAAGHETTVARASSSNGR
jgi:hypothetical protein